MQQQLIAGLDELDIEADAQQIAQLLKFVELLKKWNKVYNLTALKSSEDIVQLHLLDSLSVLPFVKSAESVIDVGSGAGLPGIPLAIMLPDVSFVLLDSNGKKTRFMQQAIIDLGLKNASVRHSRIEDYLPLEKFDTIITRAFAEINDTIEKLKHFAHNDLRLLFMKAKNLDIELKGLNKTYTAQSIKLTVPGLAADRSLVIVTQAQGAGEKHDSCNSDS